MLPIIELFEHKISLYSFLPSVGQLLAIVITFARAKKYRLSKILCVIFSIVSIAIGAVASKACYVLQYLPESLEYITSSVGADSWGTFYVFPLTMLLVALICKREYGAVLDCYTPGLFIMFAFAQLACFMNGCCSGIELYGWQIPIQSIEACAGVCIFFFTLYKSESPWFSGKLFPVALIMHGCSRFVADFFRAFEKDWLGLTHGQCFSLLAVFIGCIWIGILLKKGKNKYEKSQK